MKFQDALEHAGLKFQGRPHSGIDDARNLAHLVAKMAQRRYALTITHDDDRPWSYYGDRLSVYDKFFDVHGIFGL